MKKRESQNIIHWFIRPSKADNSAVSGEIWRTSIYACPCYPQKRRSNKNKHARVATKFLLLFKLIGIFWDAQGQVTRHTTVHDQIWHNFEHIWNFVVVSLTIPARKKKIQPKMKELGCSQHIFSDAQGQLSDGIWLKSNLIQTFMVILNTCKNDEEQFKNEGATFLPL